MQNNRRHFSRICGVLACAIALLAGCVRPYDAQIFLTCSDNTQSFLRISVPWSIRADRDRLSRAVHGLRRFADARDVYVRHGGKRRRDGAL